MEEHIVKRTRQKQLARYQIKIGGMSCSFCAETIRKACSRLDGVEKVNVSLSHEEALFQYDPSKIEPRRIEETLRNLGYKVYDPNKIRTFEEQEAELRRERNRLLISSVLTLIAALFMLGMWLGLRQFWFVYVMVGTALVNVFIVGYPILRMAYHSLRRRILNQHVLLEFGAFGGLVGGFIGFFLPSFPVADFFAVAVFITAYHILSGYASLRVRTKSSQAVRKLLDLQPPTARVVRDGEETIVNTEEVQKGEIVLIKPGESIPVDGVVMDGSSTVDESLVTGESIPAEKTVGDEVIGGSINLTGTVKVKVTQVGEESFLHQIARYVEEARALKPGILQLVDIVLKYYVLIVLLFATIGFLTWSLGMWMAFGVPDMPRAIFAALSVLVMGYPCALGMATPLAMIRGGGIAAEKGILMRSSEAFQALKDVKKIVFDKTGTITEGKPQVVEVSPLNNHDEREVLEIAVSVERLSEHPLAEAIVKKAQEHGLREKEVTDFRNFPGQGVKASLNNKAVIVGSPQFLSNNSVKLSHVQDKVIEMEEKGETVVAVVYNGAVIGLIGIADTIKEDALQTVERLKAEGLDPIILTGDNEKTARAVAAKVGIENVIAQVLPDQKSDQIRELQEQGFRVAMVGDGINDAPALMQADVGIAIGAGTDIAIESADVIIIGDRLSAVVDAYYIGRSSYGKTKLNLALAFAFNGVGVPAATTGLVHPVWAMLAMVASVSTVLLNSFGGRLVPKPKLGRKMQVNKVILEVPSMHCEGCLSTIIKAVSQIKGVESVKGDLKKRLVIVGYRDGEEVEENIRRKIIGKGYVVA